LTAGRDYPTSTGEARSWFSADADCLDYLEWLRWPDGFVCADCGHCGGWRLGDGRFRCAACRAASSVTAGTIFDRTRTPLTVWFWATWLFATQKDGVSAQSLQRALDIGSYQTAWAMLHRLRSVLVRPGRELLTGRVEVDETYMGGEEPGLRGGRAKGKKVLVAVAVELRQPKGFGRCRLAPIADASAASLHPFLTAHVAEGATVVTDGWQGYHGVAKLGYAHARLSQRVTRLRGATSSRCCRASTGSPHWPSAGCSGRTRAPSIPLTCSGTLTSSSSGSAAARRAAAPRAAGAWCSAASSSGGGARAGALLRARAKSRAEEVPSDRAQRVWSPADSRAPAGQPSMEGLTCEGTVK
jgi:hypothetical protein